MPHEHGTRADAGLRRRIAVLFDDDAGRNSTAHYFDGALALLIVANVSAVILESVEPIRASHPLAFVTLEHVATAIFAVEYGLRLWTAIDLPNGRFHRPLSGRLRYALSFFALIDLISILPAVLGLLGAGDLRVLRLLRFLRMLKLTRHSKIFGLIWAVLRQEARAIGAIVFILCLTVTISGTLMYMIEEDEQPTIFSSIPAAMWWAIETLTTVGYGDMVPVTAVGRVLGGVVAIVGIGTLALFSGLITVGFLDQLKSRRDFADSRNADHTAPTKAREICPHCGCVMDRREQAA
ncbi:ion transporter [Methylocapsa sp. S129]|uniref:ion transporter n=1 Tax=Methylocapsa sp. S129 TaxID=1641869 RepID=UPI00131AED96|nr:ion transporter [Methylocapsa sp. S129]